jgi:hypothetical protein
VHNWSNSTRLVNSPILNCRGYGNLCGWKYNLGGSPGRLHAHEHRRAELPRRRDGCKANTVSELGRCEMYGPEAKAAYALD